MFSPSPSPRSRSASRRAGHRILALVAAVALHTTSGASAQRLECEMCDQVAADSWAELEAEAFRTNERAENEAPRVEAGSRETLPEANVLTARELLIEERETLLQSRADYARSGGRIVAGGLIGLLGLGAATGVIAGRDALTLRYEVQRADGSMAQETSYALVTGLLLTAGLIALTGLSIFINGIHRRRMRHVTYRRLRRLDEQLHATDSPN